MRIIFLELTYEQVLESCNISALEKRRNLHCINLGNELSHEDHKFNHLLPPRKMRVTNRKIQDLTKNVFITILLIQIGLKVVQFYMLLIFLIKVINRNTI